MRLLNTESPHIEEFFENNVPRYAILSHRWKEDEVSFQDFNDNKRRNGNGWKKIMGCRDLALKRGFVWVWIDTCCINKESSAELSEAINSMFQWYEKAAECYVYMNDVQWAENGTGSKLFGESEWFKRGWTLQELLAPTKALFYDKEWKPIGDRKELKESISAATKIDSAFIDAYGKLKDSDEICVAVKMSWLSGRSTTRKEDIAYCMLGLFNVNMPLLYGEGEKAFLRLQLEIIKQSDDESIFAWTSYDANSGMLAASPNAFAASRDVFIDRGISEAHTIFRTAGSDFQYPRRSEDRPTYSMTYRGLQFPVRILHYYDSTWVRLKCRVNDHRAICNENMHCQYGGRCSYGKDCKHTKNCKYGNRGENVAQSDQSREKRFEEGRDCWTCKDVKRNAPEVKINLRKWPHFWRRVNCSTLVQAHGNGSINREEYESDWQNIYIKQGGKVV